MLFVLSPAKALDFETSTAPHLSLRSPEMMKHSVELIALLRTHSEAEVAELMSLSPALAALNTERYAQWSSTCTTTNSKPAILAFNGDVYEGLNASTLNTDQLQWADQHLVMLSGLYGVLRPLDWMQPYRLEMGTALASKRGHNLYEFWADRLALWVNQHETNFIINLASQEYFKALKRPALQAPVIECIFQDWKCTANNPHEGSYKIISFYAKRARGLMARFAIMHGIDQPQGLKDFNLEGYRFEASASQPERYVFRRQQASNS